MHLQRLQLNQKNMAYMVRLGLWGLGTPFNGKNLHSDELFYPNNFLQFLTDVQELIFVIEKTCCINGVFGPGNEAQWLILCPKTFAENRHR